MDVTRNADPHHCSVCRKHAVSVCKACKGTPDGMGGITAVYYCGATCQKRDWEAQHKHDCKAAKERHMNANIREVSLRVKNERLMLVGLPQKSQPIAPSAQHVVFRITLPSEECYAIDLTASQYGWHGPATLSWDTFVTERLDTIDNECGLGETKHALRGDIDANDLVRKQHQSVLDCVKKGFDHNLRVWQQQNMPLKAFSRCSEEEFKINQALLLTFMYKKISEICAKIDRKHEAETLSAWSN
ncbi:MAG: hypothetical protein Q9213_007677 [Squamulea squamosa]